jgi:hypothetical protein
VGAGGRQAGPRVAGRAHSCDSIGAGCPRCSSGAVRGDDFLQVPAHRPPGRQHARVRRGKWAAGHEWERLRGSARNDVIRAEALVRAGVAESTVYARCRAGGPWQRLLPATIMLSNGQPTPDQLVIAGLLYAGPDAVVTGLQAARRHGIRRGPEPGGRLHLLVPHGRRPASARYVDIERTHRMPPAVRMRGRAAGSGSACGRRWCT